MEKSVFFNTSQRFNLLAEGESISCNLIPSVHERMLRAFLDLVILQMLLQKSLTAYQIDCILMKKFRAHISPSVIYSKLSVMGRRRLINCRQLTFNRTAFCLTEDGKRILAKKGEIVKKISESVLLLFGSS